MYYNLVQALYPSMHNTQYVYVRFQHNKTKSHAKCLGTFAFYKCMSFVETGRGHTIEFLYRTRGRSFTFHPIK